MIALPKTLLDANLIIMNHFAAIRAALPEVDRATFDAIVASPVQPQRISLFFEFCYARREHLEDAQKQAVADVGHVATFFSLYALTVDGRGAAMQALLRGELLPEGMEEPAPLLQYAATSAAEISIPPLPSPGDE